MAPPRYDPTRVAALIRDVAAAEITPRFRALLGTVTIDGHPLPAGMQRQVQRWWGNPELPPAWLITVWRQRRRAMHTAYPARWRRG